MGFPARARICRCIESRKALRSVSSFFCSHSSRSFLQGATPWASEMRLLCNQSRSRRGHLSRPSTTVRSLLLMKSSRRLLGTSALHPRQGSRLTNPPQNLKNPKVVFRFTRESRHQTQSWEGVHSRKHEVSCHERSCAGSKSTNLLPWQVPEGGHAA
eukprot:5332345-Pyramimonas_sp.AAC.2